MPNSRMPSAGTPGEHHAQEMYGSQARADRFYRDQVVDTLTPRMVEFLARQTMMIVASVSSDGTPDASVRFGVAGFVQVLDERSLAWPEMRGNGVFTTLGNLAKTPAAHLMFLDYEHRIGLHLRGDAAILEADDMQKAHPSLGPAAPAGRPAERWVVVRLQSAYIHCRKHFPGDGPIDWGTDNIAAKGGDYFGAKRPRRS